MCPKARRHQQLGNYNASFTSPFLHLCGLPAMCIAMRQCALYFVSRSRACQSCR